MDSDIERKVEEIARARVAANKAQIEHSLQQIDAGNPLGAELDDTRRADRIVAKLGTSTRDASVLSSVIGNLALMIDEAKPLGSEAQQGPTIDFVGIDFLSRGRLAANAVGRIVLRSGRAKGTGFLVGPGLLLTNNHVIDSPGAADAMFVEFDYETADGQDRPTTRFNFNPAACFWRSPIEVLDYTLVALSGRITGEKPLESFGYLPLSAAPDKHMLGEVANIIQHPLGSPKQVIVRENDLVSRDETHNVLHYLADTERGSSGSPVCNNSWEPIALHHWGGPALELTDAAGRPLRKDINEGIRISAIVNSLAADLGQMRGETRRAVHGLLDLWTKSPRGGPVSPVEAESLPARQQQVENPKAQERGDGSISWIFPIEICVRAGGAVSANAPAMVVAPNRAPAPSSEQGSEKLGRAESDFADRGGYEPGFIPGFLVPMPSLAKVGYELARNRKATEGDDEHELRYHHFSIFINAGRRLAALTACNIDGARVVAVNRETKTVNENPTLDDLGAEATDAFQPDSRVLDTEQMASGFYNEQIVPGYPKPPFPPKDASPTVKQRYYAAMLQRNARLLQKGHIIMRGDPAWGQADEALAAEADTFFYTNAAPQFGFFNQGSPIEKPGTKGTLRWRAVETYVLRNAFVTKKRVTVFAGPVFDDKDPPYREGALIPMRFWKIAVWAEDEELRSVALLADQRPVYEQLTKGMPEAVGESSVAEAFDDHEELLRVSELLSTVAEIEKITGIDFGKMIREGDVRKGAPTASVSDGSELQLERKPLRRSRPKTRGSSKPAAGA